jgi:hypothetical protein
VLAGWVGDRGSFNNCMCSKELQQQELMRCMHGSIAHCRQTFISHLVAFFPRGLLNPRRPKSSPTICPPPWNSAGRHDFVVVETIEFFDDEDASLPGPMTLKEILTANKVRPCSQAGSERRNACCGPSAAGLCWIGFSMLLSGSWSPQTASSNPNLPSSQHGCGMFCISFHVSAWWVARQRLAAALQCWSGSRLCGPRGSCQKAERSRRCCSGPANQACA